MPAETARLRAKKGLKKRKMMSMRGFSKIHQNYKIVNLFSKKDAPDCQQIPSAKTGALACPLLPCSLHVPGTVIRTASSRCRSTRRFRRGRPAIGPTFYQGRYSLISYLRSAAANGPYSGTCIVNPLCK